MDTDQDLQDSSDATSVPELVLGLGLIGLGVYLVFQSASKPHMKPLTSAHHVPSDITFRRVLPNVYGATVTMNSADSAPCTVNLAYAPPAYVASGPPTCGVPANSITSNEVEFTVNTEPPGSQLTVTASTSDGHISKTLTV